MTSNDNSAPKWQGIHHLAMITPDMDETVRFYCGVLGMPLVTTLRAGPMRHYFFELGPGNTIAFFEDPRAETFTKPAGLMTRTDLQSSLERALVARGLLHIEVPTDQEHPNGYC